MKHNLDMSYHLLNVYTKFHIDISKHVEKSQQNSGGRTDIGTVLHDRCWNGCIKTSQPHIMAYPT